MISDSAGKAGRLFSDHRLMTEGIIYHHRAAIPWGDLPEHFGSWKTEWKRHCRYSNHGTWDTILGALLTCADAERLINLEVLVDSTVNRAHQHGTNLPRRTGEPIE